MEGLKIKATDPFVGYKIHQAQLKDDFGQYADDGWNPIRARHIAPKRYNKWYIPVKYWEKKRFISDKTR